MDLARSTRLLAVLAPLAAACASAPRNAGPPPPPEFFMTVEGTAAKLRVSVGGEGEPAVVLVHGLGTDLEAWRGQLDHLRRGRTVVAYDQRGHGESEPPADGDYGPDALTDDLEAVVKAMKLGRVVLVGHSLAGAVLTTYAGRHPEQVAGLVYLDAVGDFSAVPKAQVQSVLDRESAPSFGPAERRASFEQMLGTSARPETRRKVLASLARTDPPAYVKARRALAAFQAKPRYARYKGPAIAIEAAGPPAPILASQVLGIPRLEVSGVSHWLQLDDAPSVNGKLDAFLAGIH